MILSPKYVIDFSRYRSNCYCVINAFASAWGQNMKYGYSVKTNRDAQLIKYAYTRLHWMIETVSFDEYSYALELGVDPKDVIFNGPYKQDNLITAVLNGSLVILDSIKEIEKLCCYFQNNTIRNADFRIGLRLNFDLEKECPGETTAGENVSRFGICYENGDFKKALGMLKTANISLSGIHVHISTKTRSLKVFSNISRAVASIIKEYSLSLSFVDLGGGFFGGRFVEGKPTMDQYAKAICEELKKVLIPKNTTLILEPGASTIASAISCVVSVVSTKSIRNQSVVIVDGTMLHINPFMVPRQPQFIVHFVDKQERPIINKQIISGATCMENDRFFEVNNYVQLREGDRIEFLNAGAYTMTFNSHFILSIPNREYINFNDGDIAYD